MPPPTTPPQYVADPAQLQLIQDINKEYEKATEQIKSMVSARQALIKQMDAEENKLKKIEQINKDIETTLKQTGDYQTKINQLKTEQQIIEDLIAKKAAGTILPLEETQLQNARARASILEQETKDIDKKIEKEQNGVKKQMELEEKLAKARQEDFKKQVENFKALGALAVKASESIMDGFNFPLLGVKIRGLRDIVTDVIKAPAEAFKKFGFLDQYSKSVDGMRQSMLDAGVGEMQMREALGDLNQTVADFPNYSKGLQEDLVNTSAKLALAGFNSKTTATSFNNLVKVFGQTEQQANKTNIKLAALSKTLGDGNKTFEDFSALTPKLAGFGSKSVDVFEKTAIAAKKLGMETKELFSLMDQYDSFEKAADAAGELNVALGGQFVDSLELMKASIEGGPTDVLNLLQKSFKESGVQVENLSRAELKYFAAAAKMPEDQFKKIFAAGGEGVDGYIRKQELAAKEQENLNNIAKQTQDVFQQIQNKFAAAFANKENIDALIKVVGLIQKMAFKAADLFKEFKSMVPLMGAIFSVSAIFSFANGLKKVIDSVKLLREAELSYAAIKAFATALVPGGLVTVGLAAAAGIGSYMYLKNAMGVEGGGSGGGAPPIAATAAAATKNAEPKEKGKTTAPASNQKPVAKADDAFAPGGSTITTPQGGSMVTSADDSVIAAKEGGVLARKMDTLIEKVNDLAKRPIEVTMDGKKVNSVLADANRKNAFVT